MKLAIRKLTYAPDENAPQPRAEYAKNKMKIEVSLDKEVNIAFYFECYFFRFGVMNLASDWFIIPCTYQFA